MDNQYTIEVENICKSFKVYADKANSLKEKALSYKRNKHNNRKVLENISFSVKKGEAIGLIGSNGCGKSTTLKLLTKIIYPDSGSITMKGRVSSLIELGAGFHPDMSGRENIYTNAAIFGLTRKEIDQRIADIIEFSELGSFIDNPVRTYSSGMYMRLAFSVAINVDADILLIDEILAVGDVSFQAKCFNRLQEIKKNGTTIVIVSHSLGQIEQICERTLWIKDGKIEREGIPHDVHFEYLNYMAKLEGMNLEHDDEKSERKEIVSEDSKTENASNETREQSDDTKPMNADEAMKIKRKRWGNGKVEITKIELQDDKGNISKKFVTGEKMKIHIEFLAKQDFSKPVIGIGFWTLNGTRFYGSNTQMDGQKIAFHKDSLEKFDYEITEIPFINGIYQLEVGIEDLETCEQLDYWLDAMHFEVNTPTGEIGLSKVKHNWNFSIN